MLNDDGLAALLAEHSCIRFDTFEETGWHCAKCWEVLDISPVFTEYTDEARNNAVAAHQAAMISAAGWVKTESDSTVIARVDLPSPPSVRLPSNISMVNKDSGAPVRHRKTKTEEA